MLQNKCNELLFRFCIGVGGDALFTVFMTDYQTYAGIFTCQKLAFSHRQSATLLSRTKELDKIYLDKVCFRIVVFLFVSLNYPTYNNDIYNKINFRCVIA